MLFLFFLFITFLFINGVNYGKLGHFLQLRWHGKNSRELNLRTDQSGLWSHHFGSWLNNSLSRSFYIYIPVNNYLHFVLFILRIYHTTSDGFENSAYVIWIIFIIFMVLVCPFEAQKLIYCNCMEERYQHSLQNVIFSILQKKW